MTAAIPAAVAASTTEAAGGTEDDDEYYLEGDIINYLGLVSSPSCSSTSTKPPPSLPNLKLLEALPGDGKLGAESDGMTREASTDMLPIELIAAMDGQILVL